VRKRTVFSRAIAQLALTKLNKRASLLCDGCRHSIMIEPHEARPAVSARHADAPAHELKGDALHALSRGKDAAGRRLWIRGGTK